MRKLDYGIARNFAKDITDLVKFAKQNEEADEIHMIAIYLLGTFKEYDDTPLFTSK